MSADPVFPVDGDARPVSPLAGDSRPVSGMQADPWHELAAATPARIALGRSGGSLPTRQVLDFGLAHARARDAVHTPLDVAAVTKAIEALGLETLLIDSAAPDRPTYLRRPDQGRRLSAAGRAVLTARAGAEIEPAPDIVFVVADGLSAAAIHANAAAMLAAFLPEARRRGWRVGPVVVARQARVALGDEVGEILGARLVVMLIGERPGLSSPDSLGLYLTFAPKRGRSDAERNCISNVRSGGLGFAEAAATLSFLAQGALRLGLTGVKLKDAGGDALPAPVA